MVTPALAPGASVVTVDEGIEFIRIILQQILEFGERRIVFLWAMPAIAGVQILSALGAQSLAIRAVQWADRDFQQRIFTYQGSEVKVCVIGHKQFRFADRFFVECV